ncbi:class I SAM-dependent methyltransferase [Paenibacillus humicus]|uniref:class I SAM-dependent methyltransferase n=1 Tax=Paenibacillus humicus TaxID=412861 RepID=UPI001FE6A431|nr:class I SAM-dependent methyltransferase [Paenibacillus humicus]
MSLGMGMKPYEQQGVAVTCRSLEEYMAMFGLSGEDLAAGEIADVAGGASSFTADAAARGYRAAAFDPTYGTAVPQWHEAALAEIDASTAKLERLKNQFDWSYYGDLDRHRSGRMAALGRSAADRALPGAEYRYVAASLPELPAADGRFALVVCSHFLFLYAESFGYEFHRRSLLEMMRICAPGGRVLVYPLLSLRWEPNADLELLMEAVAAAGGITELMPSRLPFIPGSDRFLQISIPVR